MREIAILIGRRLHVLATWKTREGRRSLWITNDTKIEIGEK
jgi:hypothetical protein